MRCGFLESVSSVTHPMLWNLVKLIDGSDSLCVLLALWDDLGMAVR